MSEAVDRRRFLMLGAASVVGVATVPFLADLAAAAPATSSAVSSASTPAHGPNLVFNDSFGQAAVGEPPIGWTAR